jgi:hypothetical protein
MRTIADAIGVIVFSLGPLVAFSGVMLRNVSLPGIS